jgi:hypothetical protein
MEHLLIRAQEVAYRFSLFVCGHPEDAEDVMQDALLKTYQYVNRITEPEAFRTWLYTTVRHACLMKRRRRAGEPSHLISVEQRMPSQEGTSAPVDVVDDARPVDQRMREKITGPAGILRSQRRPGARVGGWARASGQPGRPMIGPASGLAQNTYNSRKNAVPPL